MSNLQFQNDLDRLTEVLPDKVRRHITYEKMEDVIEIVLDTETTGLDYTKVNLLMKMILIL